MKIIKYLINIETIILLVFFTIISYTIYSSFCVAFPKFNFDSQIPLTQGFASSNALLPYRDIYFPYGILFYLKHDSLFFGAIYILLLPLLFVGFLLFFKRLWGKSIYAYISFLFFVYFIVKFPGIDVFTRYGVIAALGLLFSYIFSKQAYVSGLTSLLSGLLIGAVFSLIHDQGTYAFFLYLFLLFVNPLVRVGIKEMKKRKYYFHLFSEIMSFATGIFLGFFPFLVYLVYHKIFVNFLQYLWHLSDFPVYAKTPFIPYSWTSDNLFTFSMLFLSIFFITYNIFYRKKFYLSFYIIFNYVIILILLEQKSLIRSLDIVITFLAFVLFIILAHELVIFLRKRNITEAKIFFCYLLLIAIVFFKLNLHPFSFSTYVPVHAINNRNNACMSMNLDKFLAKDNKYKEAEKSIKKDPGFSGKIFNYLSDPIFYNLFNQKPPYYFTIFEASPLYSQKENIKYIEENKVSHIIYNMDAVAIQDNVPDYARESLLFKYMLTNFKIKENIQNFLIFQKKDKDSDFFEDKNLKTFPLFQDYLLNVNLGAIPKSEGIYKEEDIYGKNDRIIISGNSHLVINDFLRKNITKTSGKILVLKARNYKKNTKETKITLRTDDAKSTTITFYKCSINKSCIINLSNIPLFYKERILKEIILDESFDDQIDLINTRTKFDLW